MNRVVGIGAPVAPLIVAIEVGVADEVVLECFFDLDLLLDFEVAVDLADDSEVVLLVAVWEVFVASSLVAVLVDSAGDEVLAGCVELGASDLGDSLSFGGSLSLGAELSLGEGGGSSLGGL